MHSATFVVELQADKNCVRTFLWCTPCTHFPIVHKKAQCLYREVSLSLQGFSVILKRLETWWAERQPNHRQPVLPSSPQESHVAELAEGFLFLRAKEVLLRSSLPFPFINMVANNYSVWWSHLQSKYGMNRTKGVYTCTCYSVLFIQNTKYSLAHSKRVQINHVTSHLLQAESM